MKGTKQRKSGRRRTRALVALAAAGLLALSPVLETEAAAADVTSDTLYVQGAGGGGGGGVCGTSSDIGGSGGQGHAGYVQLSGAVAFGSGGIGSDGSGTSRGGDGGKIVFDFPESSAVLEGASAGDGGSGGSGGGSHGGPGGAGGASTFGDASCCLTLTGSLSLRGGNGGGGGGGNGIGDGGNGGNGGSAVATLGTLALSGGGSHGISLNCGTAGAAGVFSFDGAGGAGGTASADIGTLKLTGGTASVTVGSGCTLSVGAVELVWDGEGTGPVTVLSWNTGMPDSATVGSDVPGSVCWTAYDSSGGVLSTFMTHPGSNGTLELAGASSVTAEQMLYVAAVTVSKDGVEWIDGRPVITLVSGGETYANGASVPDGTYAILADGVDTGKVIAVQDGDASASLVYYTLTLTGDEGIESLSGGGTYLSGSSAVVGAALKSGYLWAGWDDGSTVMTGRSVTVTQKTAIGALTLKDIGGSNITVDPVSGQNATGSALTPKPVIRDGEKTLAEGTDYTLSYADNTKAGTATITVTGIGSYGGTRTVSFSIVKPLEDAPRTGDGSGIGLWGALLLVSGGILAAAFIADRKRRQA